MGAFNILKVDHSCENCKNNVQLINVIKESKNSHELHIIAFNYNWDNGLLIPELIFTNIYCDFGTALMIFYLADGYRYLETGDDGTNNRKWIEFMEKLYKKIVNDEFNLKNISYTPDISKVQIYKLKKKNELIPDVFFENTPGDMMENLVL